MDHGYSEHQVRMYPAIFGKLRQFAHGLIEYRMEVAVIILYYPTRSHRYTIHTVSNLESVPFGSQFLLGIVQPAMRLERV